MSQMNGPELPGWLADNIIPTTNPAVKFPKQVERDVARDELVGALQDTAVRVLPDRTLVAIADTLIERGYRRSITYDLTKS